MRLRDVIPWGRSFSEYERMFGLGKQDLSGKILGCGDGPASFNAEATERNVSVISCDPIYAFSAAQIEAQIRSSYDTVIEQVRQNQNGFVWREFRDPDDLGQHRLRAMRRFLDDFEIGKQTGRYVTASLPQLPFENGQFSLALVSHLLFLYSQLFSIDDHRRAIEELLRVANEVRIFPLLTLDRQWSQHVEPVVDHFQRQGMKIEIRAVNYEFQKTDDHLGNRMLIVQREWPDVRSQAKDSR
ncbi:MAG: class I SAM-dependent methyltransferase [Planctomycetota bacterium]